MAKLRKIHKILEALLDRASQYPTDSIYLRAHSLLYAAIDTHLIQKRIHSPQDFPDVFHKPAKAVHRNWCLAKWGKIDPTFTRSYIAEPSPQSTLLQYLYLLYDELTAGGPKALTWGRSLHSFLFYLKEVVVPDKKGFIEQIFPKKMKLFDDQVIRNIPLTAYPIDSLKAGAVIEALISIVIAGRPNAQCNAAYALALSWICLASSRLAFPTHLFQLHLIRKENLLVSENLLTIPTFFGEIPVPISPTLVSLLETLAEMTPKSNPYLIKPTLPNLRRTFDKAIHHIPLPDDYAKITFLTLMISPHEVLNRRYQPKTTLKQDPLTPKVKLT